MAPSSDSSKQKFKSQNVMAYVKKANHDDSRIGLMRMTANRRSIFGNIDGHVNFYGAIDTGATRTLCSKSLAEELFGEWINDECQEFRLFDGSQMQCDSMVGKLELAARDGDVIDLGTRTSLEIYHPGSTW